MRLTSILLIVATCAALAAAWDKDDYEIFDIVGDLEAAEGRGTNFYSHIGVDSSASTAEINKAYRKKSLELHPDKNPGVKDIQERFARLGVISQILRSPEKRERYNFFYKNGVPKWRGTGYYYSRFRPTLTHTLAFLVVLTSLFHLLVQKLNFNRDHQRVQYFSKTALASAQAGQGKKEKFDDEVGRRVRVPMVQGNDQAGLLELIVLGDHVYVPHDDGSLEPLSELATGPSFFRTWPFLLTLSLARRAATFLPPSAQASLPALIRPVSQEIVPQQAPVVDGYEVNTRKNRKNRRDQSASATPKDTPATTDLDSDDAEEDGTTDNAEVGTEGKKKKRGVGKSGGARRRKMALKK